VSDRSPILPFSDARALYQQGYYALCSGLDGSAPNHLWLRGQFTVASLAFYSCLRADPTLTEPTLLSIQETTLGYLALAFPGQQRFPFSTQHPLDHFFACLHDFAFVPPRQLPLAAFAGAWGAAVGTRVVRPLSDSLGALYSAHPDLAAAFCSHFQLPAGLSPHSLG
jgi:hypothetical protein